MSRGKKGDKSVQKPDDMPEIVERPTDGALKFAAYCLRHVAIYLRGRDYGNTDLDDALGTTIGQLVNTAEIAKINKHYAIGIHAACGAWEAVKDGN